MGKYRKRFNEKARSGMLAKQAALKKARNKQFTRHEADGTDEVVSNENHINTEDPNSEILKPLTEEEKSERKRRLEEMIYSANEKESKMSRTKKKRLDKYIEHQLKRDEKKVLLEKLSETKMDPKLFVPSKLLGTGKQTRREEMIEALELERQGRGDERTKEILYEEREVKEWPSDIEISNKPSYESESEESNGDLEDEGLDKYGDNDSMSTTGNKSSFIDNRPLKFGGSGFGFGFENLPKIEKPKTVSKKKYSWRLRVEQDDKKKSKIEDDMDFASSSSEDENSEEDGEVNSQSENEEDEDGEKNSDGETESASDEKEDLESDENVDGEEEDSEEDDEEDSEEEASDEEEESDEELPRLLQSKPKHSSTAESFKEWAEAQVRKIEGRDGEVVMPDLPDHLKAKYSKPSVHEEDYDHSSDEENYVPVNKALKREAFYVEVDRSPEIQEQRMNLPVFSEEHKIMEAIYHHDCVIICGETGSGKTTQVPQFLYEAGFGDVNSDIHPGMIGVTQPRRVAAVSMAGRVGKELGEKHGKRVGYQIRFDSTISNEGTENGTALKFMTDGVLLREMMADLLLNKYSAIIIDEAHERNINTDILIGMLSRILKLRRKYHETDPKKYKPLKLIIMSATLRVSDFSENKLLFKTPPTILKISARQHPVSVHFNRRTNFDYMEEAFKKVCKIHRKLPPGGILVFLTGQNEITSVVKKLRKEFPFPEKAKRQGKINYADENAPKVKISKNTDAEAEDIDFSVNIKKDNLEENDDYQSDSEEEEGFEESLEEHQTDKDPLYVLPLYSLLPTKEQMKVFQNPPEGSRLCIIATNVAETSLTIPGIRYVVDSGRSKERHFNEETGVQSFEIDWISKASADQRAGRAGRTGPGHCYRLFSSAIYENYFPQFSKPEILRMPVESIVLSMKSMGIDQIVNFPFPTPPDRLALSKAEKLLTILGALDKKNNVTDLGRTMAVFPLSPRFAKILIVGNQMGCLPYIVAIVSALSVGDPFINEHELGIGHVTRKKSEDNEDESSSEEEDFVDEEAKKNLRSKFYKSRAMFSKLDKSSDGLQLLAAVCAFDHVPKEKHGEFLKNNFLRPKVMEEIFKLRKQVTNIVKINTSKDSIGVNLDEEKNLKLSVPGKKQIAAIKQMVSSGFIDQVAIRGDLISSDIDLPNKTNVINIPYATLFPSSQFGDQVSPYVYIHPNSIITNSGSIPSPYLIYQSLNLGSNQQEGKLSKLRMKPLVDISGKQLANIAKNSLLITYSKPLGHPYAPKNITPTKRECYVVPRIGAAIGDGGVGWDLPATKVIQIKVNGLWVIKN
ncbi:uncharacterized protein AC631_02660 [Debaryomyces fabryi]|uniref:RNA helicase n=1 Tax=Debaryomyces fabryi TaxID=58627 RepID=A0A0V1PZB1_9ASCO|nr:uncharacterized protein AC631_02660 [Debaryomyces fabryi]KSA01585.1 hypothetical protein AC631_02660 [Debaryomyces fabryi]CUM49862.1 unnamed protein product [Debaryomyces fabryi]